MFSLQNARILFPIIFACSLLTGCFEGYTRANRLTPNKSTVTVGATGMQYVVFNRNNGNGPVLFGDYYVSYEYDFNNNIGISALYDGRVYDSPYAAHYNFYVLTGVIDFMPKEWFVHLLLTPSYGLKAGDGSYNVYADCAIVLNLGNEWLQAYGAVNVSPLLPKQEVGIYWFPLENFFIRANVGKEDLESPVDDQGILYHGYVYAGGSLGFVW